jgi:hypothetical protein
MRINGEQPDSVYTVEIFIPRGKDTGFLFKAQAVLDFTEFDTQCPVPKPPVLKRRGEAATRDINDAGYKEKLAKYLNSRFDWMTIKSLEATPDLTWDTVDLSKIETWNNYLAELRACKFSEPEIARIIEGVTVANGINQDAMDQAYKRFLASTSEE